MTRGTSKIVANNLRSKRKNGIYTEYVVANSTYLRLSLYIENCDKAKKNELKE